MDYPLGLLFDEKYVKELKNEFFMVDSDPEMGKRLFFDNSGGSLRLKAAVERKAECEAFPDCPERGHERAKILKQIEEDATREILETVFGAKCGALMTELTASQTMFQLVGIIMENTEGKNAVVSSLEHPSAFDAVAYYCEKTGRELRVIPANPQTGGIDPEAVAALVDKDTCLLSVMSASNVSGAINDIREIVRLARAKNPELFIISDAVQHAPHCRLDAESLGIDGMNFAPYKFFGVRGCGFAYVSPRVAAFPHHKLIAKDQQVFALGTPTPGNFAAMLAVIDYVKGIGKHFLPQELDGKALYTEGMRRIHLQERGLLHRLLEGGDGHMGLRHIKGVHVFADEADLTKRDLIAAIAIDGLSLSETVEEYYKRGVVVCDRPKTSMYAKRIVEALGVEGEGTIRVSPMHCHSRCDIDSFLDVTKNIAEMANGK
jgi:selenocysteine lyase/cysteine desulfurase